MGHFAQMNTVWDAWMPEGNAPARACIEARLATPDLLVEVGIIAAR
jgi:enamine deaminase RidA (YjgF/YER057c/UK114 family)